MRDQTRRRWHPRRHNLHQRERRCPQTPTKTKETDTREYLHSRKFGSLFDQLAAPNALTQSLDDQRKPSSCGPSTIIKLLAERPDLLRTEVERLRADNERQDEQIKSRSKKLAKVNQQLARQTERINNLKQEMLRRATPKTPAAAVASDVDDKEEAEAAALEAKIQDFKKTELPVMRSLAKLIYSVEQMYREVRAVDAASLSSSSSSSLSSSSAAAAEKDRFLDEIEADLGSGRYRYFLRIGKMICEQGLDFPELEETYQVKMGEE
ncbi:uncharacterized protein IWZ02DRAFT_460602 [Phyllosticta citriasiana]|uniref:uncharacterized protein n=1 Tax=Phyllosticta citriasiana TaxID=595635 RepID=UPI0030FD7A47